MFTETILTLTLGIFIAYLFIRKRYSYWSDRGVLHTPPVFPFGTLKDVGRRIHVSKLHQNLYEKFKGQSPFVGIYMFIAPAAIVTDLELVRNVMVKDFSHFVNRGVYNNEVDDPLSANVFTLEDGRWRNLRAKLTPTFTSGKMKFMFPTIVKVAEEFRECLANEIDKGVDVDVKDILARFTTDVIGTCAFGIECNSLKDPNAEFRRMGKKIFDFTPIRFLKFLFLAIFKNFGRKLHMTLFPADVSNFFMGVVKDTVEHRVENKISRNDFMDLLVGLKNDGTLTLNEISAQAFVFFFAGFETSSTALSYVLYELSLHESIQEKGRQEVNRVLEKHGGVLTYEAISEMKYLDQIINESLRKYPPVPLIIRTASDDYQVPGTNHTFAKGNMVFIPVYGIQHDPDIYPNPEEFDPDRFSEEEIQKRHPFAFLPFGDGPRACIGLRFGMMQARVGLATLLKNFKFSKSPQTVSPLTFLPNIPVLTPAGGMWFKMEKL